MKKIISIFALIVLTVISLPAEGRFFGGGAGGYEAICLPLDLKKIDTKLNEIGLSTLDDYIYLQGGGGWGNVGNNIRIGGYGYGGSIPAINVKNDQMAREFDLNIDLGGMAIEKAFQPFMNSEINLRCIVGAGTINLEMRKWS